MNIKIFIKPVAKSLIWAVKFTNEFKHSSNSIYQHVHNSNCNIFSNYIKHMAYDKWRIIVG